MAKFNTVAIQNRAGWVARSTVVNFMAA